MKILILVLLLAVTASLFSGLYFVGIDRGTTNRAVTALTVRLVLSAAVLILLVGTHFLGGNLQ